MPSAAAWDPDPLGTRNEEEAGGGMKRIGSRARAQGRRREPGRRPHVPHLPRVNSRVTFFTLAASASFSMSSVSV